MIAMVRTRARSTWHHRGGDRLALHHELPVATGTSEILCTVAAEGLDDAIALARL
jgi:hypothetical protein